MHNLPRNIDSLVSLLVCSTTRGREKALKYPFQALFPFACADKPDKIKTNLQIPRIRAIPTRYVLIFLVLDSSLGVRFSYLSTVL
ncbi:hypothetical protein CDAR_396321 [Caerostris darwini]|uniref:Uncharacterized protein n=1 Tax=Caerostris darwini TaxID=1538125 RepID=A0AAV4UT30_9ARAC|nr:hypothetical protein CDAR_396321 [Caerostris darwini]